MSKHEDVIRIDRSAQVKYPERVKPLYSDFEKLGPSEFSLSSLHRWIHIDQENGVVTGDFLHEYLRDNGMIEDCIGLAELLEIQKLGLKIFNRYFSGKAIYGWRSVSQNWYGDLFMPYLVEDLSEVCVYWRLLSSNWRARSLALRFGKLPFGS